MEVSTAHVQQESQAAVGRGLFLGWFTTKTKREQPKPRREWQYNAEKHKGKASASRVDISGSKSELSERWRVWLRGFTYFAEGKANLQNAARKRNELLYRAGSGLQDIFENLTIITALEGQADDVYLQTVRTLNAYFRVQENAAYERHVLRQLRQEPGEDVDSFVLRLRKQARHCSYGPEELEFAVRDQLLEKISSLELRTKLFEEPNTQLAAAMEKARAWETARRQARNIAEGEGEQSKVNMVKDFDSKKPSSGFGTQKCYACGKVGHFARDKVCPARGKTCAKCGQKGHWAACCKSATESKKGGRVENGRERGKKRSSDVKRDFNSRNKQVNQVEYDSGDEPYAFPINFKGELRGKIDLFLNDWPTFVISIFDY